MGGDLLPRLLRVSPGGDGAGTAGAASVGQAPGLTLPIAAGAGAAAVGAGADHRVWSRQPWITRWALILWTTGSSSGCGCHEASSAASASSWAAYARRASL